MKPLIERGLADLDAEIVVYEPSAETRKAVLLENMPDDLLDDFKAAIAVYENVDETP